jgi:N-acetylneuraminic acid mutarotase
LLRALKHEFGFYCIELCAEAPVESEQSEMAFVMGGEIDDDSVTLSSMKRYDPSLDQWTAVAAMDTARYCVVAGEVYITGGRDHSYSLLSSVEKYSPSTDTWSTVAALLETRSNHAAVAVGSAMYVLGGEVGEEIEITASVRKFDTVEGIWRQVAPMPERSYACAACTIGSNIFFFGGRNSGYTEQASVFKYCTETNEWSTLAPMPHASNGRE